MNAGCEISHTASADVAAKASVHLCLRQTRELCLFRSETLWRVLAGARATKSLVALTAFVHLAASENFAYCMHHNG